MVTEDNVPPFIQQRLTACLPGAGTGAPTVDGGAGRGAQCAGGREDGDRKRVKAKQRLRGPAMGGVPAGWRDGQSCSERAGRSPSSDSLLSVPPQLAPHSPAAVWR